MSEETPGNFPPSSRPIRFIQVDTGRTIQQDSDVIVEMPVSLTVNGDVWLTFMCTPVDLEAMAVGFLFNEGVIVSKDEIASVHVCASADNVDVWLYHPVEKPDRWWRTSGCTGGFTSVEVDDVAQPEQPAEEEFVQPAVPNGPVLTPQQVGRLIEALFESQSLYRQSGGVHTSALSDGTSIAMVGEDIGRHNTLDKIAGHCLLDDISLAQRVILTTGRISSEMMQKASRMGAGIVISRTSPSSLSVSMAQRMGITLIGYARRHRFNIYTHPERIAGTNLSIYKSEGVASEATDEAK